MVSLLRLTPRLLPLASRSVALQISANKRRLLALSPVSTLLQRPLTTAPARAPTAAAQGSDKPAMEQPFIAGEPLRPTVLTEIPGPESKNVMEDLEKVFDTRSSSMLVNYEKSLGN
jgi:hypothetical protein